jgi:hypothetical protein
MTRLHKPSKKTISDVKLSMCWITLFSLICSTYLLLQHKQVVKDMEHRLDLCQTETERIYTNLGTILEQYKQPSVIMRMEKK